MEGVRSRAGRSRKIRGEGEHLRKRERKLEGGAYEKKTTNYLARERGEQKKRGEKKKKPRIKDAASWRGKKRIRWKGDSWGKKQFWKKTKGKTGWGKGERKKEIEWGRLDIKSVIRKGLVGSKGGRQGMRLEQVIGAVKLNVGEKKIEQGAQKTAERRGGQSSIQLNVGAALTAGKNLAWERREFMRESKSRGRLKRLLDGQGGNYA